MKKKNHHRKTKFSRLKCKGLYYAVRHYDEATATPIMTSWTLKDFEEIMNKLRQSPVYKARVSHNAQGKLTWGIEIGQPYTGWAP